MQIGTYALERSLEDWINDAVKSAVKNPCTKDSFSSELNRAMGAFASCLPACLQQDGITTTETLPSGRNVTVTSIPNKDQNKKPSHPLISEVTDGVIGLNQPIFYTVKQGDTLSDISWKVTGRKASVLDLKNWNTICGDLIKPGQVLYLADPYDPFVKEISTKLSKYELTGRDPKISLDRLSGEMVAQHGGLFEGEYQVEIKLEYRESPEDFLNSEMFGGKPEQEIPWAPDYAGGNEVGNSFNQPYNSGEERLSGGDFWGRESFQKRSDLLSTASVSSYLLGTAHTGLELYADQRLAQNELQTLRRAKALGSARYGATTAVKNSNKYLTGLKIIGKGLARPMFGVGVLLSAADVYVKNGSPESIGWALADTGVGVLGLAAGAIGVAVGAPVVGTAIVIGSVVYFTFRIGSEIYNEYGQSAGIK